MTTTNTNDVKRSAAVSAKIEGDTIALIFSNGRTLALELPQLSPAMVLRATMHGLKQKLVDASAISRNPDTGRSATVEDKYEAVREVYDRLLAGELNKIREGAGNAGSVLFKAICMVFPAKSPDALREWLAGKTDAEKAALRANAKIADAIATINAEKYSDVDTDGMLDELND